MFFCQCCYQIDGEPAHLTSQIYQERSNWFEDRWMAT